MLNEARWRAASAAVFLAILLLVAPGFSLAQSAQKTGNTADDQFMALGMARTKSDLAVRKLRIFFDAQDSNWRAAEAGLDAAHAAAIDLLRRAADEESKKPDDIRDPNVIDALNNKRAAVEQQWQHFITAERPDIETAYRAAMGSSTSLSQVFNALASLDTQWKDAHLELPTLQADFDAVAKRADQLRQAAEKSLADIRQAQNDWQKTALAATRPSP